MHMEQFLHFWKFPEANPSSLRADQRPNERIDSFEVSTTAVGAVQAKNILRSEITSDGTALVLAPSNPCSTNALVPHRFRAPCNVRDRHLCSTRDCAGFDHFWDHLLHHMQAIGTRCCGSCAMKTIVNLKGQCNPNLRAIQASLTAGREAAPIILSRSVANLDCNIAEVWTPQALLAPRGRSQASDDLCLSCKQ